MDIEFHYYMTYLIATRAGYAATDATIIAHAAQSVDDNHIPVTLTDQAGTVYENRISQTMDITRPHEDDQIYPIFHFIPGDPKSPTAKRSDGKEHVMNTTPNSALANDMIDAALRSKDLYRIGVSAHGYVDTWAHQNFVGKRDSFNEFTSGFFQNFVDKYLAVGHAFAKHNPDWPALVWEDSRLANARVDNRARFLDAAEHLFEKFVRQNKPDVSKETLAAEQASLRHDLDADIGPQDDANTNDAQRIARYITRGTTAPYGRSPVPSYAVGTWFTEAITEPRDEVLAKIKPLFNLPVLGDVQEIVGDIYSDGSRGTVTWRNPNPAIYKAYNWYKFQEAVKAHLTECSDMLRKDGHIA